MSETSVRSPRSLASAVEGGRIFSTMSAFHAAAAVGTIVAPAAT